MVTTSLFASAFQSTFTVPRIRRQLSEIEKEVEQEAALPNDEEVDLLFYTIETERKKNNLNENEWKMNEWI